MSAIPASSVSLKTMADGTLRITFDVEPSQAQDAFRLFAAPGTQVAIAALKDGSFLDQPEAEIPVSAPMPRAHMGDCCYRTVMWCQDKTFWAFLNERNPSCDTVTNAREAGELVKFLCAIDSRKELDTDSGARAVWSRLIREPYRRYLESPAR